MKPSQLYLLIAVVLLIVITPKLAQDILTLLVLATIEVIKFLILILQFFQSILEDFVA